MRVSIGKISAKALRSRSCERIVAKSESITANSAVMDMS